MTDIPLANDFIDYISGVRRYSPRTRELYADVLTRYAAYVEAEDDEGLVKNLTYSLIRSYEVYCADKCRLSPKTVSLHLSALRSFCRYLIKRKILTSNPAAQVNRPKVEKRLPEFYRKESLDKYFETTEIYLEESSAIKDFHDKLYMKFLSRLVIATLYGTGIRRAELIDLNINSMDFRRKVMRVRGKGDKVREIPIIDSLSEEIFLYLQSVNSMCGRERDGGEPLFLTPSERRMYPVFVDKIVKTELGELGGVTERKSPHVFRHTLATELLDDGADMNSIKEMLGHTSLAATQVYTHATIEQLRKVYQTAHPRAIKNGGKNGD